MKRARFIVSKAGYILEYENGAISQINGLWFGFHKKERYKPRGSSKYTIWYATELTTGMKINDDDGFLTRSEAVDYCRRMTNKVVEAINSGKPHTTKIKEMVEDKYRKEDQEMVKRLYGGV